MNAYTESSKLLSTSSAVSNQFAQNHSLQQSDSSFSNVKPVDAPSPLLAGGADNTSMKKSFFKETSPLRSLVFTVGSFAGGFISGAGVAMLLWNGLKDRFSSGIATTAEGSANAEGDIDANGDFGADGSVDIDNIEAEIVGVGFGVPGSGGADFDAEGDLDFSGDFVSPDIGLEFEGDAAVDIGGLAPVKVILAVAGVFGVVVGTFGWMIEKHMAASEERAAAKASRSESKAREEQILEMLSQGAQRAPDLANIAAS